jgi:hypothetical protein
VNKKHTDLWLLGIYWISVSDVMHRLKHILSKLDSYLEASSVQSQATSAGNTEAARQARIRDVMERVIALGGVPNVTYKNGEDGEIDVLRGFDVKVPRGGDYQDPHGLAESLIRCQYRHITNLRHPFEALPPVYACEAITNESDGERQRTLIFHLRWEFSGRGLDRTHVRYLLDRVFMDNPETPATTSCETNIKAGQYVIGMVNLILERSQLTPSHRAYVHNVDSVRECLQSLVHVFYNITGEILLFTKFNYNSWPDVLTKVLNACNPVVEVNRLFEVRSQLPRRSQFVCSLCRKYDTIFLRLTVDLQHQNPSVTIEPITQPEYAASTDVAEAQENAETPPRA